MYREKIEDLITWKNSKNKQPLIIRGARQVGKTWLMKEFGKTNYKNVAYIHFDNNSRMEELFKGDLIPAKIIEGLQIETGEKIEPKETLIIFDEIQEVPRALTALKYFQEEAPEYDIIAAGSLLRSSIT
jgi:predicted AAA+ superfamily ATPase